MTRIIVSRNSEVEISKALMKAIQRKLSVKITNIVQRSADREIGKFMRFIAAQTISRANFNMLTPYLPSGRTWRPYSPRYRDRKLQTKGFLHWFYYNGDLYQDFQSETPTSVVRALGKSQVSAITPTGLIKVRVVPRLKLKLNNTEDQLYSSGLITEKTLRKLHNRKNRYRPLVGPVLYYFLDQKVRQAVVADLRKELKR